MSRDSGQLLEFYIEHTYGNLLPYWLRHIDHEHGGVLNCISNSGEKRLLDHKFTWSQGRWAYIAARISQDARGLIREDQRQELLNSSRDTARFLMKHARLPGGNCAFVMSQDGCPVLLNADGTARQAADGEIYDYSIMADHFAYYGVSEYARITGDRQAYEWAKDLYLSCERREATGSARNDYPYPIPPGYRTHGGPMILIENARTMAEAADRFSDTGFASHCRGVAKRSMEQVLRSFAQDDNIVLEMVGLDGRPVNTLLGTYCNPGHTLEDLWFILHLAAELGDRQPTARAAAICLATCELAWDDEYGGIPQFADRTSGGQPCGQVPEELADHVMVQKLRKLWDKKLWWPHSEALYTLLLVAELTGEAWAHQWYERFHEYTFATFPHRDPQVGEWIQIRDRQGAPEEAVVALPVKDPMHILRAFGHIINCIRKSSGLNG